MAAIAIVLLVLAWGVQQVGNVGVRRVQPLGERITLTFSQPVQPGAPAQVHWNVPSQTSNRDLVFQVRTATDTLLIGDGQLAQGVATVGWPCDGLGESVGLTMQDAATDEVIASASVTVLPPGPDCLR